MPDFYTEFWSGGRMDLLKKARQEGARLGLVKNQVPAVHLSAAVPPARGRGWMV